MIFDWKNGKEEAKENGIHVDEVKCLDYQRITMKTSDGVVSNHTFRDFEQIEFEEDVLIENCIFENCGDLTLYDGRINNCTFRNVASLFVNNSKITNSTFSDIKCKNDFVISLEDSTVSHCNFENVELRKDSVLADGVGDSCVKNCTFKDILTDRYDGEIFKGENIVGSIFKRTERFDLCETDTCTGLDEIIAL